jgi:hypothetical protein
VVIVEADVVVIRRIVTQTADVDICNFILPCPQRSFRTKF